MHKFFLITMLSLSFVACEKNDKPAKNSLPGQNQPIFPMDMDEDVDEDVDTHFKSVQNTQIPAISPTQKTGNVDDRTITQNIRRAITSDASLSKNAKNIKIIAIHGVITLRGNVDSNAEIDSILKKVNETRGVTKVNSQLVASHTN